MDAFIVQRPGLFTSVQDRGRSGYLDRGVPLSGAVDTYAFRIANLLVGNAPDAAVLEITMLGPILEIQSDADIALTGADMGMTLNGEPVPGWQSLRVKQGDIIRMPRAKSGCRAYLAVTGGIDVPIVMGSRSTCSRAKLGGYEGRILREKDLLRRADGPLLSKPRGLPGKWIPAYSREISLRAIPGPQDDAFRKDLESFFSAEYEVTLQADRMGYRLKGPAIHHDEGLPESIISEAITPGNVQLPADGQPIILLVEQTSGGYTKIATVISTDIRRVAQAVPRARIRFERVTLEEAHRLCRQEAQLMGEIEEYLGSQGKDMA
jgi:biotin-dependent carboxylase-like uncharacterized protein